MMNVVLRDLVSLRDRAGDVAAPLGVVALGVYFGWLALSAVRRARRAHERRAVVVRLYWLAAIEWLLTVSFLVGVTLYWTGVVAL